MGAYKGAPDKVPHEVDFVLVRGGGHVGLVEIGGHGGVVGELFEEGAHFVGNFGVLF